MCSDAGSAVIAAGSLLCVAGVRKIMSPPKSSLARNHFLDALRGIAALLVLATHLQSSITGFYPGGWLASHPVVVATLQHGAIGVDVFFLISGFIVYLAARRVIHAGKGVRLFLLKRFLRIFLPYWPIALALAAAYALLPGLSAAADPIQVNWLKSLTLIPGGAITPCLWPGLSVSNCFSTFF